jgi:hypothetical protein
MSEPEPQRRMTDAQVKAVTQAGIDRGVLINHTQLAIIRARLLEAGATMDQVATFGPTIGTMAPPTPETFTPRNRRERRRMAAARRRA